MQLPDAYLLPAQSLIGVARAALERGESLQAVALVGNLLTHSIVAIPIDAASAEGKNRAVKVIRAAALHTDADFVLTIFEGWALTTKAAASHEELPCKYEGPLAEHPGRLDIVSAVLDTARGTWSGLANIRKVGRSKKKRTFGPVELEKVDAIGGRFGGLLPKKGDSVVH